MSNSSRLFRYRLAAGDGSSLRVFFTRADVNSATLILNGVTNAEPAVVALSGQYRVIIPSRGGNKTKVAYARSVTIKMLAAGGGLSIGSRVIVPVFQFTIWTQYRRDQVGTYNGISCICTDINPGSPQNNGREF